MSLISGGVKYDNEIVDFVLWFEIKQYQEDIELHTSTVEIFRSKTKKNYFRNWTIVPASDLKEIKLFKMKHHGQEFFVSNTKYYLPWWLVKDKYPPENEFMPCESNFDNLCEKLLSNAFGTVKNDDKQTYQKQNYRLSMLESSKESSVYSQEIDTNESFDINKNVGNKASSYRDYREKPVSETSSEYSFENSCESKNQVHIHSGNEALSLSIHRDSPVNNTLSEIMSNNRQNNNQSFQNASLTTSGIVSANVRCEDQISVTIQEFNSSGESSSKSGCSSALDFENKVQEPDNNKSLNMKNCNESNETVKIPVVDSKNFHSIVEHFRVIKGYMDLVFCYEDYLKEIEMKKNELDELFQDMVVKSVIEKYKLDEKGIKGGRHVTFFKRLSFNSKNICEEATLSRELYNRKAIEFNESTKRALHAEIPPEVLKAMEFILKTSSFQIEENRTERFPVYETSKDVQTSSLYLDLTKSSQK